MIMHEISDISKFMFGDKKGIFLIYNVQQIHSIILSHKTQKLEEHLRDFLKVKFL